VPVAGVLLVFSFLVVPAAIGSLLADGLPRRLLVGWAAALVAALLGLALSWAYDLPTGAAIVSVFGVLLALAAGVAKLAAR
jgi:zinc/manganese transport system permease protein